MLLALANEAGWPVLCLTIILMMMMMTMMKTEHWITDPLQPQSPVEGDRSGSRRMTEEGSPCSSDGLASTEQDTHASFYVANR